MFKFILIASLCGMVNVAALIGADPSISSELLDTITVPTVINKKFEFTERFIAEFGKLYNQLPEKEKLDIEDALKFVYFFEDNQQIFSESAKALKVKFNQIQEHMQKELQNMTPEVQKFIKQTATILFNHAKSHLIEGKEINPYGIMFDLLEEYLEMSPAGQNTISDLYKYVNDQIASVQTVFDEMSEKIRIASKPALTDNEF
ncbi:hypothetical protein M3Y97_00749500 [Aphelenchoides bicaudatus]|nr:hypothetical protein M3Y97_00749500 [Aphelenchoides bicaudatus]